jgi:hypothetical protein
LVDLDCFDVAAVVDLASVFDFHPLLTLPIVPYRKWIKKALLFEPKASFKAFPFFVPHNWEAEGQWQRGRLFWVTFFGEAKKGNWLSGHPRPTSQQSTTQVIQNKKTKIKNNPQEREQIPPSKPEHYDSY